MTKKKNGKSSSDTIMACRLMFSSWVNDTVDIKCSGKMSRTIGIFRPAGVSRRSVEAVISRCLTAKEAPTTRRRGGSRASTSVTTAELLGSAPTAEEARTGVARCVDIHVVLDAISHEVGVQVQASPHVKGQPQRIVQVLLDDSGSGIRALATLETGVAEVYVFVESDIVGLVLHDAPWLEHTPQVRWFTIPTVSTDDIPALCMWLAQPRASRTLRPPGVMELRKSLDAAMARLLMDHTHGMWVADVRLTREQHEKSGHAVGQAQLCDMVLVTGLHGEEDPSKHAYFHGGACFRKIDGDRQTHCAWLVGAASSPSPAFKPTPHGHDGVSLSPGLLEGRWRILPSSFSLVSKQVHHPVSSHPSNTDVQLLAMRTVLSIRRQPEIERFERLAKIMPATCSHDASAGIVTLSDVAGNSVFSMKARLSENRERWEVHVKDGEQLFVVTKRDGADAMIRGLAKLLVKHNVLVGAFWRQVLLCMLATENDNLARVTRWLSETRHVSGWGEWFDIATETPVWRALPHVWDAILGTGAWKAWSMYGDYSASPARVLDHAPYVQGGLYVWPHSCVVEKGTEWACAVDGVGVSMVRFRPQAWKASIELTPTPAKAWLCIDEHMYEFALDTLDCIDKGIRPACGTLKVVKVGSRILVTSTKEFGMVVMRGVNSVFRINALV